MRIKTISSKEIMFSEEELDILSQANTILQNVRTELKKEDYYSSVESNGTEVLEDIYFTMTEIDDYMDF